MCLAFSSFTFIHMLTDKKLTYNFDNLSVSYFSSTKYCLTPFSQILRLCFFLGSVYRKSICLGELLGFEMLL